MLYIALGFIFGFFIPYLSRRFSKFMPATFAYGLYRIFKPNKIVSIKKRNSRYKYVKLRKEYLMYSLGWAVVSAVLTYLTYLYFKEFAVWHVFFIWSMLLLFEIDKRMLLLPDILTVPLLLIGFLYSALGIGLVVVGDSAIGAVFGYFLPVIVSLFIVWKEKDAFGGGDIKLLSAIGAWFGLEALLYVIILSCFVFAGYAIAKQKREGAFGPAIVVAAIVVMFVFFVGGFGWL